MQLQLKRERKSSYFNKRVQRYRPCAAQMLSENKPIEISEKTHENCHYYTLLKDYFLTRVGRSCWGFVSVANEFYPLRQRFGIHVKF